MSNSETEPCIRCNDRLYWSLKAVCTGTRYATIDRCIHTSLCATRADHSHNTHSTPSVCLSGRTTFFFQEDPTASHNGSVATVSEMKNCIGEHTAKIKAERRMWVPSNSNNECLTDARDSRQHPRYVCRRRCKRRTLFCIIMHEKDRVFVRPIVALAPMLRILVSFFGYARD